MSLKLDGTGKITGIDQGLNVVGVGTFSTDLSAGGNVVISGDVVVGGGLTVTGVLTYEDVTNVDSIGVITARSGIVGDLTGNVTGNVTGDITGNIIGSPTLSGISSSISDTAVDIFVYDTSKDSDGGAWRKRTQHTSWYNETLNTATRGSRREFPAVAVIVADSSYTIKIYDGDDPDLPLWMKFQYVSSGSGLIPSLSAKPESIAAINGVIVFGNVAGTVNSGQAGVLKLDFIGDAAYRYMQSGSSGYSGKWIGGGLANRNTGTPTTGSWDNSLGYIVDNDVNDVAMTVLPSAPIDSATGLPVPTIAVATDGGVSVIKDDGTVVDHIDSAGGPSTQVAFTQDGKLAHSHDGHTGIRIDSLKSSDFTYGSNKAARHNSEEFYINYGLISSGWSGNAPKLNTGGFNSGGQIVPVQDNILAERADTGLNLLARDFPGSPDNNRVAYATTSYNTGWMHGDMKGAFLSDTDATNVTATDLTTNGSFTTDSDWTKGEQWTISGGSASITDSPNRTTDSLLTQSISGLQAGKSYIATVTWSTSTGDFDLTLGGVATRVYSIASTYGASGTRTFNITAASSDTLFGIVANQHLVGSFDSISLKLAEQDRSVNNKGLEVFGTITKSAVATGAELVAYSGFSGSNYLLQPYNSDLNFGTSNFCVMGWFKLASNNTQECIMMLQNLTGEIDYLLIEQQSNGDIRMQVDVYNGAAVAYHTTQPTDVWIHYCGLRISDRCQLYINGSRSSELDNGFYFNTSFSFDNTDGSLYIGRRTDGTNPFSGQLALWKISSGLPSPEQIKKIYEDEKVLFQENAKCTLYGSSDAVTALAYDEVTDRLHVGTSSGRSDFQGLRRINNTTTAVTTAISAHDEFIAEQ